MFETFEFVLNQQKQEPKADLFCFAVAKVMRTRKMAFFFWSRQSLIMKGGNPLFTSTDSQARNNNSDSTSHQAMLQRMELIRMNRLFLGICFMRHPINSINHRSILAIHVKRGREYENDIIGERKSRRQEQRPSVVISIYTPNSSSATVILPKEHELKNKSK